MKGDYINTTELSNRNYIKCIKKRSKNKSSELLKEQLHKIANTVVNELDLGRLTNNQRIQLIKAVLPYLISKQKNIEDLQQEQPLFQIVSKN